MEQHGPHLPVGVDTFLSEGVCKAAAEAIAGEMCKSSMVTSSVTEKQSCTSIRLS